MNKNMLSILIHVQLVLIEFKSKENIFLSFFFLENPDKSRIGIEEDEIIEPDLQKANIFSQVEEHLAKIVAKQTSLFSQFESTQVKYYGL